MKTRLAVAVLSWRGEEMTRQCVTSLRSRDGWTMPIAVIDNGSETGEGDRLAAEFGIACISLPENGGVPAGYNAAILWAREQAATHVLLANNDLVFEDPDLASRLAAHAVPGVAAVGPIIRNDDGSVASAGTRVHRWTGHAERTNVPFATSPHDVDALDGACMLVSVDAACRIGGLEPTFFLYWEETDWCARARAAGLRLVLDPGASVTHLGHGSGDLRTTRRYALRNSLLYLRRNVRGFPLLTGSVAWWFGRLPVFLLRRLLERATPASVLADATWAIRWHVRDVRRSGWRRVADGPRLCP